MIHQSGIFMIRYYTVILIKLLIFLPSVFTGFEAKNHRETLIEIKFTPEKFAQLPPELAENSGMVYDRGLLWTITDSGGPNILYGVTLNGEIVAEVTLAGASNIDWEDIAQDKNHFYIADVGNNIGNRENLTIYKVDKNQINLNGKQEAEAQKINFSYPDQVDFTPAPHAHPFDCEAIVSYADSLYLFTKDWVNGWTSIYSLPKSPGNYTAAKSAVLFNSRGLITGADITPDGNTVFLVGYNQFKPFAWIMGDFDPSNASSWKKVYIDIGSLLMAQTEGIAFVSKDTLLISCERTPVVPEQLFLLPSGLYQ